MLSWIDSERHSSRFIENRVAEIRKHKDITFHYVPSKENPADLASRGLYINELLGNSLWWHGPEWMLKVSNGAKIRNRYMKQSLMQLRLHRRYQN